MRVSCFSHFCQSCCFGPHWLDELQCWLGLERPTHIITHTCLFFPHLKPMWFSFAFSDIFFLGSDAWLISWAKRDCERPSTKQSIFGCLIGPFSLCVFQVPWPPRCMAESCKRHLEKWPSKTLQGAVRPTDHPAWREDAHGPVFPTRGPCHSRARWALFSFSFFTVRGEHSLGFVD